MLGIRRYDLSISEMARYDELEALIDRVREIKQARAAVRHAAPARPAMRGARLVHIRQSLPGMSTVQAETLFKKMSKSKMFVKSKEFTYVYEQSGIDESTRGRNFHAHIRAWVTGSYRTPGQVAAMLVTKHKLGAASTQVMYHDNICALKNYMAGHKGTAKQMGVDQDLIWRRELGLQSEYNLR
ncbi:hypothetical protein ABBQ38_005345 [Trebouxia sp. C0009 RCD-2024]